MRDEQPTAEGRPNHHPTVSRAHRRPRFQLETDAEPTEILERIRRGLARSPTVQGMVLDSGRVELTLSEEQVRPWSPQLVVDVEDGEDGAVVEARFGPHPHIWTLYVFLHSLSVVFALGCTLYGLSRLKVGLDPWVLFLVPASFVLSGLVYGASFVGQGLGALQMQELRSFLEAAVGRRDDQSALRESER